MRESGGGLVTRSGRYRDTVECRPGEEIVGDTSHSLKVCRVGSYRKLLDSLRGDRLRNLF